MWFTAHRLRLRLGLCLCLGGPFSEGEVGDEVAKVDCECAAPDGEPLQVGHLRARRQVQGQVSLYRDKSLGKINAINIKFP